MSASRTDFPDNADGLLAVLRTLRAPDGCPWDRKQTRQTLVKHLDGECAELIDAILRNDVPNIREELGDVLMNLLFQVAIAEENGEFTLTDVWREIIDKMIRRHAHVFGDAHAANADEVVGLWQQIKAAEKGGKTVPGSVMDEVKLTLCPLERAEKLQKKAAELNFDWQKTQDVLDKITEEVAEVKDALASGNEDDADEEIGDLLFAVVNLIRFRHRDNAVNIMRKSNMKFERRFRLLERAAADSGRNLAEMTLEEMDVLWEKVKSGESMPVQQ